MITDRTLQADWLSLLALAEDPQNRKERHKAEMEAEKDTDKKAPEPKGIGHVDPAEAVRTWAGSQLAILPLWLSLQHLNFAAWPATMQRCSHVAVPDLRLLCSTRAHHKPTPGLQRTIWTV